MLAVACSASLHLLDPFSALDDAALSNALQSGDVSTRGVALRRALQRGYGDFAGGDLSQLDLDGHDLRCLKARG